MAHHFSVIFSILSYVILCPSSIALVRRLVVCLLVDPIFPGTLPRAIPCHGIAPAAGLGGMQASVCVWGAQDGRCAGQPATLGAAALWLVNVLFRRVCVFSWWASHPAPFLSRQLCVWQAIHCACEQVIPTARLPSSSPPTRPTFPPTSPLMSICFCSPARQPLGGRYSPATKKPTDFSLRRVQDVCEWLAKNE